MTMPSKSKRRPGVGLIVLPHLAFTARQLQFSIRPAAAHLEIVLAQPRHAAEVAQHHHQTNGLVQPRHKASAKHETLSGSTAERGRKRRDGVGTGIKYTMTPHLTVETEAARYKAEQWILITHVNHHSRIQTPYQIIQPVLQIPALIRGEYQNVSLPACRN